MATIKRPGLLANTTLPEHLRWQKHTTDNIDRVNEAVEDLEDSVDTLEETVDGLSGGGTISVIESVVAAASRVALVRATMKDITSITLTPGTWLVTGLIQFDQTVLGLSYHGISISTAAAPSSGTIGDTYLLWTVPNTAAGALLDVSNGQTDVMPFKKFTVVVNTTVYLQAVANWVTGSHYAYGRITAASIS
jgi:hypothetical protein